MMNTSRHFGSNLFDCTLTYFVIIIQLGTHFSCILFLLLFYVGRGWEGFEKYFASQEDGSSEKIENYWNRV